MATVSQPGVYNVQEFTSLGALAAGYRLYTFVQGTTTKKVAYTDAAGATAHTYTTGGDGIEYIALDARGELPAPLYLTSGAYDLTLKTAAGATVWTRRTDGVQTVAAIGGTGDGTTDDSSAIAANITARTILNYKFGGLTLTNSQTLDFGYMQAKAKTGASFMVNLTNYGPVVTRVYVSDSLGATDAFKFGQSSYARITDAWIFNALTGINFAPGSSNYCSRPILSNIQIDTFTVNGVTIGTNVLEVNASNVFIDSGLDTVNNYPKRGTIGWNQDTPVTTYGVGGHLLSNVTVINTETGFFFDDAQLTSLSNCIADTTAGYGVKITGASQYLNFSNMFVGTGEGVYVGGTSTGVTFNGLTTLFTGVIPPFSVNPNFFLNAAGTQFDVTVADTASVKIEGDSWYGRKLVSVATGAALTVTGGVRRVWDTTGTVAAATTTYLDDDGQTATEQDTYFRMPFDGYLFSMDAHADGSPSGSDTFIYTVRVNAVDTAMVATISAANTSIRYYPSAAISVSKGSYISIKLVTSATASARRHTGNLHLLAL